jgi:hypothetical protein
MHYFAINALRIPNFYDKIKRAGYGDATSLRRGVDRLTVVLKNIMEGLKVKQNKAFWACSRPGEGAF